MDRFSLFLVSLFAAAFGAGLGFRQFFFESSGDKRSLLVILVESGPTPG